MTQPKTKAERDTQFERIAWRIAAKKGLTLQEASGHLIERLSIKLISELLGAVMGKESSRPPNPYAYEARTCVCSICGAKTRIDGTDCVAMNTYSPHVPWEMMVGTRWTRGEEVCLSCIKELPEKWRKLFDPPFPEKI